MKNESCVVRGWTKETLTVEVTNSLGERYYFEVPPNADLRGIKGQETSTLKRLDGKGIYLECHIPIASQLEMFK